MAKEVTALAVASRGAALSAFRELINGDPVEARTILRRPISPMIWVSGEPVRMGPSTLIGELQRRARYTLGAGDPETTRAIADRPSEVLSRRPSITSDTVAAYAKASLDLTMEGGTTSGVVYPLAVCDLATDFQFRNVGGVGRQLRGAHSGGTGLVAAAPVLASGLGPGRYRARESSATTSGNHIRRGFTGLTDIIGWLTQTRAGDSGDRRVPASPSSSDPAGQQLPSSGLRSRSCVARAGHCHYSPSLHLDGSPACSRSP